MLDWSRATRGVVDFIPEGPMLDAVGSSWEQAVGSGTIFIQGINSIDISTLRSASSMSALASVASVAQLLWIVTPDKTDIRRDAAAQDVLDLASRPQEKEEVRELLKKFGMARAQGSKCSPLDHFNTAQAAFETTVQPYNAAITSLIPMRSCILDILADLLRRRPRQEKAGNTAQKVLSLGRQCARESTTPKEIAILASRCADLLEKHLSPSKDRTLTRAEWQSSLVAAMEWIRAFLHSIDPNKLRKARTVT